MHEYSIVQALLEQCEYYAKENKAKHISKVVVKIGEMSGVEPELLEVAFETFKENSICAGAEFVMNMQKVKVRCHECIAENEILERSYCCMNCGSNNVEVIDGEDMYLMSLEIDL